MHVAERCITDLRSALGVAKALNQGWVTISNRDLWDKIITDDNFKDISIGGSSFPFHKKAKVIILCGCADCEHAIPRYIDSIKQWRRDDALDK